MENPDASRPASLGSVVPPPSRVNERNSQSENARSSMNPRTDNTNNGGDRNTGREGNNQPRTGTAASRRTSESYGGDAYTDVNNPHVATRGDWWLGSLYY